MMKATAGKDRLNTAVSRKWLKRLTRDLVGLGWSEEVAEAGAKRLILED